jgi:hypothetical protein
MDEPTRPCCTNYIQHVTGLQAPANLSVVVANMNTRRRKKVTHNKQPPVMDCKHQSTVTFYKKK